MRDYYNSFLFEFYRGKTIEIKVNKKSIFLNVPINADGLNLQYDNHNDKNKIKIFYMNKGNLVGEEIINSEIDKEKIFQEIISTLKMHY